MPSNPTYRVLASTVQAIANCIQSRNKEWEPKHLQRIMQVMDSFGPSGSGIDNGTQLDLEKSTGEKLVFTTDYHHMDDAGGYDGWTEHTVTVTASLISDIDVSISGRNRNDIKDVLHDVFCAFLKEELVWQNGKDRYVLARFAHEPEQRQQ